jgi:hypothetical protein
VRHLVLRVGSLESLHFPLMQSLEQVNSGVVLRDPVEVLKPDPSVVVGGRGRPLVSQSRCSKLVKTE